MSKYSATFTRLTTQLTRCAPCWHSFGQSPEIREFLARQARRKAQRATAIRAAVRQAVRVLRVHHGQSRPIYAAQVSAQSVMSSDTDSALRDGGAR